MPLMRSSLWARDEAGRGGPIFDAELGINVLEMFANRARADGEDLRDLSVRFSASNPKQDLLFARC